MASASGVSHDLPDQRSTDFSETIACIHYYILSKRFSEINFLSGILTFWHLMIFSFSLTCAHMAGEDGKCHSSYSWKQFFSNYWFFCVLVGFARLLFWISDVLGILNLNDSSFFLQLYQLLAKFSKRYSCYKLLPIRKATKLCRNALRMLRF